MKTLQISIILILLSITYSTEMAYGEQLVPKTLSELYQEYQGKLVIAGQILSVSEIPQKNLTSYDIKIQDYITRPQQGSIITAVSPTGNTSNPVFNVNDKVQLYLDKNSSGYVISPYSFKMSGSCSSFGPSYDNFGPLSDGAAASIPFKFVSSQGNTITPIVNQQNLMSYDVFNDLPLNKTTVEINITLNDNPVPVFHDTKYLDLKPCTGTTLTWNFTPVQMGNYTAVVKQTFGVYDNKIILGNYTLVNYGFSPIQTDTTDLLLSPLKQFRSGTLAQDVECGQGLQLVMKAEDDSPACVRSETAKTLSERGWTESIANRTSQTSTTSNQAVEIVSIQMVQSLINPGGPPIQLTLKNIGVTPITSLNATLHLNNEYNFDFQDITKSYLLVSGNSTSDTKILIGGGFTSEAIYPLTINGIANNIPFSFTQNVHIPYPNEDNVKNSMTSSPVSSGGCDTPYESKQDLLPILYMSTNSTGKLCIQYSNPNQSFPAAFDVVEAQNYNQNTDVTVSSSPEDVPSGNSTIVDTIHSGNKAGFYRMLISCPGMQLAIGYDNSSNFVPNDFPWLGQTFYCPLQSGEFHIIGLNGIGVKYIPYP